MPELCDVSYSRDTCIAAIRDYYDFLKRMYLDESTVLEPPAEGWPFDADDLRDLGKSDDVIALLRHLPYISHNEANAAHDCYFADWQFFASCMKEGNCDGEEARLLTEKCDLYEILPPHVVSLSGGPRDNTVFLLDVELGIILWHGCPSEIYIDPTREMVSDSPWDYAGDDEEQAQWRGESRAWAIADFFELLIDQFRALNYVPLGPRTVMRSSRINPPRLDCMIPMVQDIFRQHGWPDLERFQKTECLEAVYNALKERYPGEEER